MPATHPASASVIVTAPDEEDHTGSVACCVAPLPELTRPVYVSGASISDGYAGDETFWTWPILGPLIFENESSDVRDHCANERTFLSYLRLSVYMAVVAVAIILSFHLKNQPSPLELKIARPMGAIFWALSVASLGLGIANYIRTVNKYSRRAAIVQTGWKTQMILSVVALCIIGACVVLLVVTKLSAGDRL